jgi:hypothetical protein
MKATKSNTAKIMILRFSNEKLTAVPSLVKTIESRNKKLFQKQFFRFLVIKAVKEKLSGAFGGIWTRDHYLTKVCGIK